MGNEGSMTCRGRVRVLAVQISCCLEAEGDNRAGEWGHSDSGMEE